jgi:hypothetical protein
MGATIARPLAAALQLDDLDPASVATALQGRGRTLARRHWRNHQREGPR